MTNNTAIVIPTTSIKGVKNRDQLDQLLDSLKEYRQIDIIVCFDACSREFIRYFQEKYAGLFQSVINEGNRLNFARNCNTGMKVCLERNQNCILVNQDCKMPREKEVLDSLCQMVGITNPLCTDQLEIPEGDGLINEIESKFPFFCTFIHLDVIKKIGVLDGIFYPNGGCEDDDYLIRAKLAGFKTYVANIYVYHEGSYIDGSNPLWESASGSYSNQTLGISLNKLYTKYQCEPTVAHADLMNWVLQNRKFDERMVVHPRQE